MINVNEINAKILLLGSDSKVDVFRVGKSLFDRDVLGLHVGDYVGNQIMIIGSIHATDYVSSLMLIKITECLKNKNFNGGFYFVPLVNPDGVELAINGIDSVPCKKFREYLLSINCGNENFSSWQANCNAVDLNSNFNIMWGEGAQNVKCPEPKNFIGFYPESEREVRCLIDFTLKNQPAMTIDYYIGEDIIYYGFESQTREEMSKNLKIANNIASINNYSVLRSDGNVGGFQEFSISSLNIPSISIFAGGNFKELNDQDLLDKIFEKNKEVPLVALESINSMKIATIGNGKRLWKGLCLRH